jgi:hypothetical protein
MTNPETIIIPRTILIPTNEAESALGFKYRFVNGHLDFQTNSLQVVFEGNFSQQFTMANAKQYDFARSKNCSSCIMLHIDVHVSDVSFGFKNSSVICPRCLSCANLSALKEAEFPLAIDKVCQLEASILPI